MNNFIRLLLLLINHDLVIRPTFFSAFWSTYNPTSHRCFQLFPSTLHSLPHPHLPFLYNFLLLFRAIVNANLIEISLILSLFDKFIIIIIFIRQFIFVIFLLFFIYLYFLFLNVLIIFLLFFIYFSFIFLLLFLIIFLLS